MAKKSNKHRQGPIKIFDLRVETPSSNDKNLAYDILNWGLKGGDNLYPVDALLAITNSPTASACMSTRTSYVRGGGFNISEIERIKVNNDEKFGDLHTGLSETVNKLKGVAIHVKRNIGGEIVALNKMPFEDFRLQVPNENNEVTHVHYNPRWGQGDFKTSETIIYPLYTTDPLDYIKRLAEFRDKYPDKKYTGEVYWKFIKKDGFPYYPFPLSEIDLKVFQTDTSFAEFDFNNIENNFLLSFIMNVYGDPNDPIKEYYNTIVDGQEVSNERIIGTRGELFNEEMQANFGGAKNTGKGMVNWMQTESQKMDVSAFPNNTNSDLFKDTQSRIWNKIALITQVPNILANIETAGKMGGSQEKLESIQLLNDSVTIQQNLLEQAYNELLPKHVLFKNIVLDNEIVIKKKNPITFLPDQVWSIIPDAAKLKYIAENYNIDIEIEEQQVDEAGQQIPLTPEAQVNENLKGLRLADFNKVLSYKKKYKDGKISKQEAELMLKGFGFSESEISTFLEVNEEENGL